MNLKHLLFLLALISMPALSQTQASTATSSQNPPSELETPERKAPTALQWIERLSLSLKNLNFDTSFVVVRNNRAEPYRWLHGVDSDKELEIVTLLNGPRKESIRIENVVSYFESDNPPYSVFGSSITGPIPSAFWNNIDKLKQTYHFVGVGKSRILGRPAQLIRLESKDKRRFGYWLWLDIQSGLLLKSAIISPTGELLEQVQFTHLSITEQSHDILKQLHSAELPDPIENQGVKSEFSWNVNWLPQGFELKNASQSHLGNINEQVESLLFNDGLVNVSVYVARSEQSDRAPSVNQTGATVVFSQLRDGYEINVVGKVPANTALAIAESISFK